MVKFLKPSLERRFGGRVSIQFVDVEGELPQEVKEKMREYPLPLVYFDDVFKFAGTLNYSVLARHLGEVGIREE
ncbi:hypothetical protein [Carboxydothermus hydrogenoformans]|uniref:Uncharacterized protein n=1 Tax=Carboxydothermus hydrogenoformans (strain ATCC BAA-161 / DSM 6008 / Z-2901) TaxID=246194 RepID=Q3AAI9_CARHZ|nr:hypothetical protein [Carboxydothermus hydrogenoformans]ABB16049.1 hypothetical protein CHY_2026 [Carboxydothermus hydrogenoformans Z-2901]